MLVTIYVLLRKNNHVTKHISDEVICKQMRHFFSIFAVNKKKPLAKYSISYANSLQDFFVQKY